MDPQIPLGLEPQQQLPQPLEEKEREKEKEKEREKQQNTRKQKKIHCKQELIVSNLQKFYSERTDMKEIMPILLGTSDLSLRLVDWFVTNYAKKHNIGYILDGQEFLVYMNYKSQLKAYSKKLFDPFCRRERIMFQNPGQEAFVTTVGKLNFFRWAIEKGVLTYLKLNSAKIETEMNKAMKEQNKVRSSTASSTESNGTQMTQVSEASYASGNTGAASTSSSRSTRRRNQEKEQAGAKLMQKHELEIEVRFD